MDKLRSIFPTKRALLLMVTKDTINVFARLGSLIRVGINSGPEDQGPGDPKETLNPRIRILL